VTTHDLLVPALELAFRHDSQVLVEEMIEGREMEVGILGNKDPIASLPGLLRINADWYDYDAKYLPGGMDLEVPAPVDAVLTEELQRIAKLAFRICKCSGMARVDFFTSTSVYARLFEATGITYAQLLERLIELAIERHQEAQQYLY
jgi:D-alanine-D-alanine ligase